MPIVAFDLDGTLFHTREDVDFGSVESVREGTRPDPTNCARACALAEMGHRVVYVTARPLFLRAVTVVQISVKARLPPGHLFMPAVWAGYDAAAVWKGGVLRELGAAVYVGDHPSDRQAAQLAGIPFIHADELRAGALLPEVLA